MAIPSFSESMLGRVLVDRYELTELIGEGGMGTVFRAHQLGVGRDVAVKILNPTLAEDKNLVTKLFFREARAVCQLTHPNTITLFDFGRSKEGLLYITMELVRGVPLSRMLDQGALPLEPALHIIEQVAESLMEAHMRGIIHQDIKPDNILVEPKVWDSQVVKVLDFGIAKVIGSTMEQSKPALRFGTPLYMSPEQILGQPSDARTDIYTLGAVLFECLSGKPPFLANTAVDICIKHLDAELPRIETWDSPWSYPAAVVELIRFMMAKAPADRPQSVDYVRQEIRRIRQTESEEGDTAILPADTARKHRKTEQVELDRPSIRHMGTAQSISFSEDMEKRVDKWRSTHTEHEKRAKPAPPIPGLDMEKLADPQVLITQIIPIEIVAGQARLSTPEETALPPTSSSATPSRAASKQQKKRASPSAMKTPNKEDRNALASWVQPALLLLSFILLVLIFLVVESR